MVDTGRTLRDGLDSGLDEEVCVAIEIWRSKLKKRIIAEDQFYCLFLSEIIN